MYWTECLASNRNKKVRMPRWMSVETKLETMKNKYNIIYNKVFRSNKDIAEEIKKLN